MNNIPDILQELFLKNLAYFKRQNPSIYALANAIKIKDTSIKIDDLGKIELIYHGREIYSGDAIKYAQDEVFEFSKTYKNGKVSRTVNIVYPDLYKIPRFFQKHLNTTVNEMYNLDAEIEPKILHHNNNYDFLVVMGVGLGLHISEAIEKLEIKNLFIYETDYELLTLSLFFTDWEEIYRKQSPTNGKSLTIIASNNDSEEIEYGLFWNEMIKRAPHFPYNTVFYNHGRHEKYGRFIKKIMDDQKMFLSLWGNYDDEINQLNHILHNINNTAISIPNIGKFQWNKPVFICGSGPSLDSRINEIKSKREDVILLSAGTSLSALLNNGIKPDFHIEIESDYSVYTILKSLEKDEELKNINLICGLQSTPYLKELFKKCFYFIKDSMATGHILTDPKNTLLDPTPTCVNAALSLAVHYQAKEIYLFGTDFGFYDSKNHHSEKSIYNTTNKKIESIIEETNEYMKDNFTQPGYLGECLTTNTYFTTKRRIEMTVNRSKNIYNTNFFNCSDGLIIEGTQHIDKNTKLPIKSNRNEIEFSKHTNKIDKKIIREVKSRLQNIVYDLCERIKINTARIDPNIEELSKLCWSISEFLNTTLVKNHGSVAYFIKGTFNHYMLSGYTIAYAYKTEDQPKAILIWKKRFINFLEELPKDLEKTLNQDRKNFKLDKRLERTIMEPID